MRKLTIIGLSAGTALLCAVPVSLQWSQDKLSVSLDTANAVIGRPLTPGSIAGVNRRAERRAARRAYYGGAGYYGAGPLYGATAVGVTAPAAPYNTNWGWTDPAPGYGVATVPARAALASTAYGVNRPYAAGVYPSWNSGAYPTRAIYRAGIWPGYYGPVCDPRFDAGCQ
jgi:hypothetical protein